MSSHYYAHTRKILIFTGDLNDNADLLSRQLTTNKLLMLIMKCNELEPEKEYDIHEKKLFRLTIFFYTKIAFLVKFIN